MNANELVAEYLERHPRIYSFNVGEVFRSYRSELTRLPEILPPGLTTLVLGECPRLTHLPKNLPTGLATLVLVGCPKLTHLPENLPAGLTTIIIEFCYGLT